MPLAWSQYRCSSSQFEREALPPSVATLEPPQPWLPGACSCLPSHPTAPASSPILLQDVLHLTRRSVPDRSAHSLTFGRFQAPRPSIRPPRTLTRAPAEGPQSSPQGPRRQRMLLAWSQYRCSSYPPGPQARLPSAATQRLVPEPGLSGQLPLPLWLPGACSCPPSHQAPIVSFLFH